LTFPLSVFRETLLFHFSSGRSLEGGRYTTSTPLHIDTEGFQKLRGHDVESDRELEFDSAAGVSLAAMALKVASVGRRIRRSRRRRRARRAAPR